MDIKYVDYIQVSNGVLTELFSLLHLSDVYIITFFLAQRERLNAEQLYNLLRNAICALFKLRINNNLHQLTLAMYELDIRAKDTQNFVSTFNKWIKSLRTPYQDLFIVFAECVYHLRPYTIAYFEHNKYGKMIATINSIVA